MLILARSLLSSQKRCNIDLRSATCSTANRTQDTCAYRVFIILQFYRSRAILAAVCAVSPDKITMRTGACYFPRVRACAIACARYIQPLLQHNSCRARELRTFENGELCR